MHIIELIHITKEYHLGELTNLRQTVVNGFSHLLGRTAEKKSPFKALDDVSMTIKPGEVVGIIGSNGAGKSTLLKLLARVARPTRGSVVVRGTVAPLIEIGGGFVGDLTGRENIYLNGAILGLSRSEIRKRFDEIVAFAELEEFIDSPLKRYSSGMAIRLGFAVATSADADILIIDEVLAVGDIAFQQKCYDRMNDLIRREDKTLLIVGHNVRQLERISTRMILLDQGKIFLDGWPAKVCNAYLNRTFWKIDKTAAGEEGGFKPLHDSGEVEVRGIDIFSGMETNPTSEVAMHKPMSIRVHFIANKTILFPEVIIGFHTNDFVYVGSASSAMLRDRQDWVKGSYLFNCTLQDVILRPGIYYVRLVFSDRFRRLIWHGESLKMFRVITDDTINSGKLPELGLVNLPFIWTFRLNEVTNEE